jgi:hypothetical protein
MLALFTIDDDNAVPPREVTVNFREFYELLRACPVYTTRQAIIYWLAMVISKEKSKCKRRDSTMTGKQGAFMDKCQVSNDGQIGNTLIPNPDSPRDRNRYSENADSGSDNADSGSDNDDSGPDNDDDEDTDPDSKGTGANVCAGTTTTTTSTSSTSSNSSGSDSKTLTLAELGDQLTTSESAADSEEGEDRLTAEKTVTLGTNEGERKGEGEGEGEEEQDLQTEMEERARRGRENTPRGSRGSRGSILNRGSGTRRSSMNGIRLTRSQKSTLVAPPGVGSVHVGPQAILDCLPGERILARVPSVLYAINMGRSSVASFINGSLPMFCGTLLLTPFRIAWVSSLPAIKDSDMPGLSTSRFSYQDSNAYGNNTLSVPLGGIRDATRDRNLLNITTADAAIIRTAFPLGGSGSTQV